MTAVSLRPARSTDAGAVGQILSSFIDETDWMPRLHTRAEDVAFAGRMIDRDWVTVADTDRGVVGFGALDQEDVAALYIASHARGRGIGRALVRHMQAEAERLKLWTFMANTPAQRFYEHLGFVEVERTDGAGNDEKLPDIRYEWHRKDKT